MAAERLVRVDDLPPSWRAMAAGADGWVSATYEGERIVGIAWNADGLSQREYDRLKAEANAAAILRREARAAEKREREAMEGRIAAYAGRTWGRDDLVGGADEMRATLGAAGLDQPPPALVAALLAARPIYGAAPDTYDDDHDIIIPRALRIGVGGWHGKSSPFLAVDGWDCVAHAETSSAVVEMEWTLFDLTLPKEAT